MSGNVKGFSGILSAPPYPREQHPLVLRETFNQAMAQIERSFASDAMIDDADVLLQMLGASYTSDGALGTVPAGAMIIGVTLQELAGHNVTVSLGTTPTGAEILGATVVAASTIVPVNGPTMLLQAWVADQPVYVHSASWGSAQLATALWYLKSPRGSASFPPSPPPPPPTPGDLTGVTAGRIADLLEPFGFNLYPMLTFPGTNEFGAQASGDWTVSSIATMYGWLTADVSGAPFGSGMVMMARLWTYQGQDGQINLKSLGIALAQATGMKFTLTSGGVPGADSSIPYANAMAADSASGAHGWTGRAFRSVLFVEGYNEPNGIGGETAAQTATGQASISVVSGITRVGPSVVFGLPFPDGYISGFLSGTDLATVVANSDAWNVHFYPPFNPDIDDGSGRGGTFDDVFLGINTGYGATLPQSITEWHPTLYNTTPGNNSNQAYDAYYLPMYLLSAYRLGFEAYVWWSLLDFSSTTGFGGFDGTGFWQNHDGTDPPRNTAYVLRAMFALTGDTGSSKRSFTPAKLDYTVAGWATPAAAGVGGIPAAIAGSPNTGGQTMLFQNSTAGTFFLFVWNSQNDPGGAPVNVVINFAHTLTSIKDYDLVTTPTTNMTPVQSLSGVNTITVSLDAGVHLLVITY